MKSPQHRQNSNKTNDRSSSSSPPQPPSTDLNLNNFLSTDLIKTTLQKGNNLIRETPSMALASISASSALTSKPTNAQNKLTPIRKNSHSINLSRINNEVIPQINAYALFSEIHSQLLKNDEQQKRSIINILLYAQKVHQNFCSEISQTDNNHQYNSRHHLSTNPQPYTKSLNKFKIIQRKLNQQLSKLTFLDQTGIQKINNLKNFFQKYTELLSQKSHKYSQLHHAPLNSKSDISSLSKIFIPQQKQNEQSQQQSQQQAIKEEMLQLLDNLKGQAINIGSGLKKDNAIISQIDTKQNKQINTLSNKSEAIQEIINSQRIGFFKLVSMAGIGIALWLFTVLFIVIV